MLCFITKFKISNNYDTLKIKTKLKLLLRERNIANYSNER